MSHRYQPITTLGTNFRKEKLTTPQSTPTLPSITSQRPRCSPRHHPPDWRRTRWSLAYLHTCRHPSRAPHLGATPAPRSLGRRRRRVLPGAVGKGYTTLGTGRPISASKEKRHRPDLSLFSNIWLLAVAHEIALAVSRTSNSVFSPSTKKNISRADNYFV